MCPKNRPLMIWVLTAVAAAVFMQDTDGSAASISQGIPGCEEGIAIPVPEYCNLYQKCELHKDIRLLVWQIRTCLPGRVFDNDPDGCVEPHLVTSRPECKAVSSTTTTTTQASQQVHSGEQEDVLPIRDTTDVPDGGLLNDIPPTPGSDYRGVPNENNTSDAPIEIEMVGETEFNDTEVVVNVNDVHTKIQEVATQSDLVCQHVGAIQNYVTHLTSNIPLQMEQLKHVNNNQTVLSYNKVLVKSQNMVLDWRHGNDILSDIQKTFLLAKQYETTFDQKYKTYQGKHKSSSSSSSNPDEIQRLNEEIKSIKEDIKKSEDAAKFAPPSIYPIIENIIKSKRKKLEVMNQTLQEALNPGFELLSLPIFIDTVSDDSLEIEDTANNSRARLIDWRNPLLDVQRNLENGSKSLKEITVKDLNRIIREHKDDIEKKQNRIKILQDRKNALNLEKDHLKNAIRTKLQNVCRKDIQDPIQRELDDNETKLKNCVKEDREIEFKEHLYKVLHCIEPVINEKIEIFNPPPDRSKDQEYLRQQWGAAQQNNWLEVLRQQVIQKKNWQKEMSYQLKTTLPINCQKELQDQWNTTQQNDCEKEFENKVQNDMQQLQNATNNYEEDQLQQEVEKVIAPSSTSKPRLLTNCEKEQQLQWNATRRNNCQKELQQQWNNMQWQWNAFQRNICQEDLQQQWNAMQDYNSRIMKRIEEIFINLARKQRNIHKNENDIDRLQSEILLLEMEERYVKFFINEHEPVQKAWTPVYQAIGSIIDALSKVKSTFHTISRNLKGLLSQEEEIQNVTVEDEAHFQKVRNDTDRSLEELQSQIDHSSVNINEIRDCT